VGAIGVVTVVALALWLPRRPVTGDESVARELAALRRPQVLLALLIGTVGFGGMFAMYAFIAPTMTELAGLAESFVPWVLAAYGLGMVTGMVLAGRVARRGVLRGIVVVLALIAALLGVFGWAVHIAWLGVAMVYVLGLLPSILVPLLQIRLMDVAHEGQSLAAALNHSTLNLANALGAWLGSVVLAAGWGYGAPSRVGAVLAVLGVGVALWSAALERRRA
jgi:DHA1 family inner membrane transport protein